MIVALLSLAMATPPAPSFDAAEAAALDSGEVVYRWDGGEGGTAAMLVDGDQDAILGVIVDFDAYVEYLPYVTASSTDAVDGDRVDATLELTTRGLVSVHRVTAEVHRDDGYVRFDVDGVQGPVRDGDGWWQVRDWGDGRTLLVYRVDTRMAWWVPWFTKRYAARRGLPTVVRLVGERVEGA